MYVCMQIIILNRLHSRWSQSTPCTSPFCHLHFGYLAFVFSPKVPLHFLSFFFFFFVFFFFPTPFRISFLFKLASRRWLIKACFRDLFCSCAFFGPKEKVLVLIQSPQSVFICTATVIYSLACCDLCCFYFMYSFRPLLCRHTSLQANVK